MRHRDDRARVVLQEPFEPAHRLGVEVVGRFVEQQQVGRLQQQPTQRHAAPLAARKRGDVGVGRRQPQRVHRQIEAAVEIPRVGGVDPVLQPRLLFEHLVHLLGRHLLAELHVHGVVVVEQLPHLGDALFDVAAHVLGRIQHRLLRQVADGDAFAGERLAAEVVVEAGHDLQQRRLARAVQAEDADLGAGKEREPDVLEDLVVGLVDFPEPLHGVDELRHRWGLGSGG